MEGAVGLEESDVGWNRFETSLGASMGASGRMFGTRGGSAIDEGGQT